MNRFTLSYQGSVLAETNICIKDGVRIKEISCTTDLDEGSDNLGSGGMQKGFVYGKEYTFKVTAYQNDAEPSDDEIQKIKWEYDYATAQGVTMVGQKESSGETFTLKIDDLEMLGQEITIHAYIEDKEVEAKVPVFCHHRFRYFDRKIVIEQAEARMANPWLIDQGGTSLCGMACIFYIFAKNHPKAYADLVKELHTKGKSTYNSYTVAPNEDSLEMYDTNPYSSNKHPSIPEVDWITMATTRSKESNFGYTGQKGQDASAINWPWMMTELGKKLLGFKTVEMDYYKINKSYIRDFFGSDEKIRILEEDIDKDYQNGYEVCMMIDADMVSFNPGPNYSLDDFEEYHWVTYEGGLKILNKDNKSETDYDDVINVQFNVFTWGELRDGKTLKNKKRMPKIKITKDQFIANYYGYLKLK